MEARTKQRIVGNAAEIFRHVEAGTYPEYSKKRGASTVAFYQAIDILNLIKEKPMTAYEIAPLIRRNSQSVFQYLGAMEEGGIPIKRKQETVVGRTGRPETIFSL